MLLTEVEESNSRADSQIHLRMRLLEQMAEALEDEAAGLYRRAAAFEEEEFLLNREIEERHTEINRLQLKLDALRAERDRVMEKIDSVSAEASAMRDEVLNNEAEVALARIDESVGSVNDDTGHTALFFRRATMVEHPGMV